MREESSVGAVRDPFSAFEQGHISPKKIPNSWYWKFPWDHWLIYPWLESRFIPLYV